MDDMAVGLGGAIAALRKELTAALQAKGGVKFGVVSLEGKGQLARDSRNRIKLLLQPVGTEGGDLLVGSEQAARPR